MDTVKTSKLMAALTLAIIALALLALALSLQSARAQAGGIYVDKQLGRGDPVVYVGEYLTFTIFIRNDATFTVTTLPLSDTYNAAVLGFADADPPPDSVNTGTGRLDWNDLTTTFGDLAPDQSILVVVGFVAEHPAPAVVNAAEVHDAIGSAGALSDTVSTASNTESIGGSSPVDKELLAGLTPQVGQPLTFTITITNDGFTTMTIAPLVDTYNPAWMAFSTAVPPPDVVDTAAGTLIWLDLTQQLGDVPPHGTLSVTTVFTALTATDNAANHAQVAGAVDWYGNELSGGGDDVPITIIGAPSAPTPTATPTQVVRKQRPGPTATATATPLPTPTEAVPLLPATGQAVEWRVMRDGLSLIVFILGTGVAILARKARPTGADTIRRDEE
jgi:hypothetical protein